LLPGVADDHKKAATSMAMVGSTLFGGITTSYRRLAPRTPAAP
jgi:hypothetical protein